MSSQNKIILIGTPTEDPNVKVSTNGHPMASFRLAVDRPTSPGGHTVQDHIPVVAWREAAESAEHCKKGQLVLVEGRIQTRSYENNEGQRRYVTEVDARTVRAVTQNTTNDSIENTSIEQEAGLPQYNFGDPAPKTETAEPEETLPPTLEEKPVEAATTGAFDFNTPFTDDSTTDEQSDSNSQDVPF